MKAGRSDEQAPAGLVSGRYEWLLLPAASFGVLCFVDLLFWADGGGVLSVVAGFRAAAAQTPAIDIDGNGLLWAIMMAFCLPTFGLCRFFGVDLGRRRNQTLAILAMTTTGFALNGFYGDWTIGQFMAARGYSRCPLRDHEAGHGKGRVRFDNYVRATSACVAAP